MAAGKESATLVGSVVNATGVRTPRLTFIKLKIPITLDYSRAVQYFEVLVLWVDFFYLYLTYIKPPKKQDQQIQHAFSIFPQGTAA